MLGRVALAPEIWWTSSRPNEVIIVARWLWLCALQLISLTVSAAPPTDRREVLDATLWVQQSFEYRYGGEQAFKSAAAKLRDAMAPGTAALEQEMTGQPYSALPAAIIFDLDETLLDNSEYQGWQLRNGKPFDPESWDQWVTLGKAGAVPGALAFTRTAHAHGIKLFFVTNRECKKDVAANKPLAERCPQKLHTIRNMVELGFPQASDENAYFFANERGWTTDKKERRETIGKTHRIIMMLGDDLGDFIPRTMLNKLRSREDNADYGRYLPYFGERWFTIANPMYGSWERYVLQSACGANDTARECTDKQIERKYDRLKSAMLGATGELENIKLATWNLEWFMTPQVFDQLAPTCFSGGENPPGNVRSIPCNIVRPNSMRRSDADIAKLKEYASKLNADVIALQEVDGPVAAATVFQGYEFCFTKRAHVQNVGFAIRRGIPYQCNPDLTELGLAADRVRWGVDVTLVPNTPRAIRVLGVHLKSGCNFQSLADTREDCKLLAQQVPVLESWIDARAQEGVRFAVLGDFNRRINNDLTPARDANGNLQSLWAEIDDGEPPEADLTNVSSILPFTNCSNQQQFSAYIDDILMSKRTTASSVTNSQERIVFDDADARRLNLSDHCPVAIKVKVSP